jgi:Na+-transporting NADH:ubiquinone oxidoreductase subunit NqrB
MVYRLLADLILILHFCFVLFAILGGLMVLRWRWMWKFHLPALAWSFLVQYFVWICPLTDWENHFRGLGGEAGYEGGFIEYFISAILYPGIITPQIHLLLAISLVTFNLLVYAFLFRRLRLYP